MNIERDTVMVALFLAVLIIFGGPWVVMHAWELIAVNMFGAPELSYCAAFFGTWAMHIIFNLRVNKS